MRLTATAGVSVDGVMRGPGASREVQVHASAGLFQSLLADHLVDGVNLFTSPVIVGEGRRLFAGRGDR